MTDTTPERIWVVYAEGSESRDELPEVFAALEEWELEKLAKCYESPAVPFLPADLHAAVVAERDNAMARADATERAFGELASKVPLPEVIRATGTVGDFAAWFCEVVAERDQMKAAMKEIMRHCPDKATRLEACKALEKNDE